MNKQSIDYQRGSEWLKGGKTPILEVNMTFRFPEFNGIGFTVCARSANLFVGYLARPDGDRGTFRSAFQVHSTWGTAKTPDQAVGDCIQNFAKTECEEDKNCDS